MCTNPCSKSKKLKNKTTIRWFYRDSKYFVDRMRHIELKEKEKKNKLAKTVNAVFSRFLAIIFCLALIKSFQRHS